MRGARGALSSKETKANVAAGQFPIDEDLFFFKVVPVLPKNPQKTTKQEPLKYDLYYIIFFIEECSRLCQSVAFLPSQLSTLLPSQSLGESPALIQLSDVRAVIAVRQWERL